MPFGSLVPILLVASVPATTPLLGPPDPAGPTARGVYVQDPEGQVEHLTARGTLVAWTVRTPADTLPPPNSLSERPRRLPERTTLVVADERGGAPLTVDLEGRWVNRLVLIRSRRSEPQLAVESCTGHKRASCSAELLTLTTVAPPTVAARTRGADARAAVLGELDGGRRIVAPTRARKRGCDARLTVRAPGARPFRLPRLPKRDATYKRCGGLDDWWIFGTHVFATVSRSAPKLHFDADFLYGLDLSAGSAARWRELYRPYRSTDGSVGLTAGPGTTDGALFYEELDDETEAPYWLSRITLPGGALGVTDAPIAPGATGTCHIAATDAAVYELSNPRCAVFQGTGEAGQINRIVNPAFAPPKD